MKPLHQEVRLEVPAEENHAGGMAATQALVKWTRSIPNSALAAYSWLSAAMERKRETVRPVPRDTTELLIVASVLTCMKLSASMPPIGGAGPTSVEKLRINSTILDGQ